MACSRNVDISVCSDDVADLASRLFSTFIACICYSMWKILSYENGSYIRWLSVRTKWYNIKWMFRRYEFPVISELFNYRFINTIDGWVVSVNNRKTAR